MFSIAVALGIGMAPILATWAFLWNFVPQIGGFMGGLPLVLFGFVRRTRSAACSAAVIYIVYQFIENHVIQPAVIGAAIDVAPWGTLVAALVGAAAAGVCRCRGDHAAGRRDAGDAARDGQGRLSRHHREDRRPEPLTRRGVSTALASQLGVDQDLEDRLAVVVGSGALDHAAGRLIAVDDRSCRCCCRRSGRDRAPT